MANALADFDRIYSAYQSGRRNRLVEEELAANREERAVINRQRQRQLDLNELQSDRAQTQLDLQQRTSDRADQQERARINSQMNQALRVEGGGTADIDDILSDSGKGQALLHTVTSNPTWKNQFDPEGKFDPSELWIEQLPDGNYALMGEDRNGEDIAFSKDRSADPSDPIQTFTKDEMNAFVRNQVDYSSAVAGTPSRSQISTVSDALNLEVGDEPVPVPPSFDEFMETRDLEEQDVMARLEQDPERRAAKQAAVAEKRGPVPATRPSASEKRGPEPEFASRRDRGIGDFSEDPVFDAPRLSNTERVARNVGVRTRAFFRGSDAAKDISTLLQEELELAGVEKEVPARANTSNENFIKESAKQPPASDREKEELARIASNKQESENYKSRKARALIAERMYANGIKSDPEELRRYVSTGKWDKTSYTKIGKNQYSDGEGNIVTQPDVYTEEDLLKLEKGMADLMAKKQGIMRQFVEEGVAAGGMKFFGKGAEQARKDYVARVNGEMGLVLKSEGIDMTDPVKVTMVAKRFTEADKAIQERKGGFFSFLSDEENMNSASVVINGIRAAVEPGAEIEKLYDPVNNTWSQLNQESGEDEIAISAAGQDAIIRHAIDIKSQGSDKEISEIIAEVTQIAFSQMPR
jgi:hypothetical protein